jgi:hypothetical protein
MQNNSPAHTKSSGSSAVSRPMKIAGMIAACIALCWLGTVTRRPFIIAARIKAENDKLNQRVLTVKLKNQRLRRDVAALETDAGKEREARRLGYLKENEVPLIIVDK